MPELPEVEITARRLDEALAGATIESARRAGHQRAEDVRPAAAGARRAARSRACGGIGKHLAIDVERRPRAARAPHERRAPAALRQARRAARPHVAAARPDRRRARAAPARVRHQAGGVGEAARGRRAWAPRRSSPRSAPRRGPTRPRTCAALLEGAARRCTRCCATSASSPASAARGSTRSCGPRGCRRSSAATTSTRTRRRVAARGDRHDARRDARALRAGRQAADPRQAAAAAAGPSQGRRAVPALRHDDRGRPLRGLRHVLLPATSRRAARCSRTAACRGC